MKPVIGGACDVSHKIFEHVPVMHARVVGEACEGNNCKSDVYSGSKGEVEQFANEGSVRVFLHFNDVFWSFWTVVDGEDFTGW